MSDVPPANPYPPNMPLASAKPGKVTTVGILMLISGILNLIAALSWSVGALFTIVGIICIPVTVLPGILGIFEIIYAGKLLSTGSMPKLGGLQIISGLEIASMLFGNIFSAVLGIVNLVFVSDSEVQNYLAARG